MDTALGAVIVAAAAVIVNAGVSVFLHFRRVSSDADLAQKKFDFDKALAERKLILDQKANSIKQAQDFATQMLAGFYEIQRMMPAIRSPASFEGQGQSRPKREGESEDIKKLRDGYFVVAERLNKHNELISRILAMQFKAMTYFGPAAGVPFESLNSLLAELTTSISMLIMTAEELPTPSSIKWKDTIWGFRKDDAFQARLDEIVSQVDALCRPILTAAQASSAALASSR